MNSSLSTVAEEVVVIGIYTSPFTQYLRVVLGNIPLLTLLLDH